MHVTIDRAGRIVIPKRVREALGLEGGDELELSADNDRIELARPARESRVIESPSGNLTIAPGTGANPAEVRKLIERSREHRS